jgi:hypothetical protein
MPFWGMSQQVKIFISFFSVSFSYFLGLLPFSKPESNSNSILIFFLSNWIGLPWVAGG